MRKRSAGTTIGPEWGADPGRLRECCRGGGVKGHVPFDLLRNLVNMAVQYSHRTEPPEQKRACAPSSVPQPHSG